MLKNHDRGGLSGPLPQIKNPHGRSLLHRALQDVNASHILIGKYFISLGVKALPASSVCVSWHGASVAAGPLQVTQHFFGDALLCDAELVDEFLQHHQSKRHRLALQ